jgi:polyhydroxyalkanoate synthesis regulator phasin
LAPEEVVDSVVERGEVVAQDVKQITESLLKTYRQELLGRLVKVFG